MDYNLKMFEEFLIAKGINIEEVKQYLIQIEKELKNKKYGLIWEEKDEDVYQELLKKLPVLQEVKDREIKTDKKKATNILIEGDNLHSLKSLQFTHKNKCSVIYIDPPYNLGNRDFVYNDEFVDKEDAWRHSKWLSFMDKRLKLAKELMSDDGIIFISIDDNEFAQLKLLCDSIFGEDNNLGCISVVNNLKGRSDDKFFATSNEFLLVYSKNKDISTIKGLPLTEERSKEYKYADKISRYKEVMLRKTGKSSLREDRENMFYPIYFDTKTKKSSTAKMNSKNEIEIYPLNEDGVECRWRWSKETYELKKDTEIVIRLNNKNKWTVYVKMRDIVDGVARTQKPKTIWINPQYDSSKGTSLIKDLFKENIFTNPKPLSFIIDILRISSEQNSIILDFFAGSGTTGQAVMELNKEDGGSRQFILCTNNENNICEDVTYERLNKVINGYITPKGKEVEGLRGNLKYYKVELEEDYKDINENIENLIDKCTSLISIKENCFEILESNLEYDIVANQDMVVLIYKNYLALDYEVEEIACKLLNYEHKNKVIYTTNPNAVINDIEVKEYPVEIIEQLKILKRR